MGKVGGGMIPEGEAGIWGGLWLRGTIIKVVEGKVYSSFLDRPLADSKSKKEGQHRIQTLKTSVISNCTDRNTNRIVKAVQT